jgi:hypothetical protein
MENENNNGNNNGNNGNNGDANINIINSNYYAEEYRIDNNNNNYNREPGPGPGPGPLPEQELMNNVQVLPIAMHSNMLRMLYELRVPLYALGALAGGGGGGGAADDDMEQAAVAVLARSLYDARPVKHVIDVGDGESDEKHGIREMAYDPETAEEQKINTACGIWQEEFEKGEAIKVLPCNHAFRAEAITKWLTTEKAECPICRFKLESKEVIVHPPAGEGDMPRLMSDDSDIGNDNDDDNDNDEVPQPQPQPPVDEQRARENNIMYRQNNNIYNRAHGGGAADMGRDIYYGVSMPMNQLLQMRGRLVHGGRAAGAGAGGGGGGAAAAMPSSQPPQYQPSQPSQPLQPIITNINNYYINRINQYQISAEEQEEADIEEAIRRSLE